MARRIRLTSLSAYSLAMLAVGGTTVIMYLLRDVLSPAVIALFFLLPVGASAIGGLGPGLAAAVSAFLAFNYFFIPPYYTLVVHQTQDLFVLIVFFIIALVISQLVGRTQSSRAIAQTREREATHLYALSTALAGQHENREIAATLGQHLQEMFQPIGVEVTIVTSDQPAPFHYQSSTQSLPANAQRYQVPLVTPRGSMGTIQLWLSPESDNPDEHLLNVFASQGALTIERAALAQADTRAKVLGESDRLKSALLSSVSHELRSPLATIKAAATSLRSGDVSWESQARDDLLAAIDEEVDLMNRLIGNLLDMSRIESGALKPQREWNILAEILGGVLTRMRRAAENHQIVVDVSEDLPLAPIDYVQIEQVFSNLISNSLKYAPPQTVIQITARVEHEALLVQVSNQGPPVPVEYLDRIFDKFYRVTAADRVTGTGLGLSICKGIIEAHGGRIWAENLPDRFAFNFTLPLSLPGQPPPNLPVETDSA